MIKILKRLKTHIQVILLFLMIIALQIDSHFRVCKFNFLYKNMYKFMHTKMSMKNTLAINIVCRTILFYEKNNLQKENKKSVKAFLRWVFVLCFVEVWSYR